MILEGSYPYVHGGVSSWMHQYIQAMPDTCFVLWCIGAESANRGVYKYELPPNVDEVKEVFLDDAVYDNNKSSRRTSNLYLTAAEQRHEEASYDGGYDALLGCYA